VGRVRPLVVPVGEVSPRGGTDELVILYPVAGLLEETIEIELVGDVLVVDAKGRDAATGGLFELHGEVLLDTVPPRPSTRFHYAGAVLEVRVVRGSAERQAV
jgi:HSP20 family molecular chaperone IbpA